MDADLYWTLGSTAALPLLLVAEVIMSRRERRAQRGADGWGRRHAGLLVDGALVLGWLVFLYIEVVTHIAWL